MRKKCLSVTVLLCFTVFLALWSKKPLPVQKNTKLSGEVQFMQVHGGYYDIRITAGNAGGDFKGTVRLVFSHSEQGCVFDTEVFLPSHDKKTFVVSVPDGDVTRTGGNGVLIFLDQKGKEQRRISFKNIFKDGKGIIHAGILCDDFEKISNMHLDCDGANYYTFPYNMGNGRKIRLQKLDKDTLKDSLDEQYFLIIDSYDVSALGKDTIKAVEDWVIHGGRLIIGTGKRGAETLNAFNPDFTGCQFAGASKKGEENPYSAVMDADKGYFNYQTNEIDFTNMEMAEFLVTGNAEDAAENPGKVSSCGDGGILILAYSLCDDEMQKGGALLYDRIYREVELSRGVYTAYPDFGTGCTYVFRTIDEQRAALDAVSPAVFLILCAVFTGPVLYKVLDGKGKRIYYQPCAVLMSLFAIGVVCLFYSRFQETFPRIYSITTQRADGMDRGKIYTDYCLYHSGIKPWRLKLKDNYTAGGTYTAFNPQDKKTGDWICRVIYGNGIELGFKPDVRFENMYMTAAGTGENCGTICVKNIKIGKQTLSGSITNDTKWDFPYMMVVAPDERVMVIKDVKQGETIELAKEAPSSRQYTSITGMYESVLDYGQNGFVGKGKETELFAALVGGFDHAAAEFQMNKQKLLVCAVVPDYNKTTAVTGEISYGCLYTVAEQEIMTGGKANAKHFLKCLPTTCR